MSRELDAERCRRLLAEARADTTIHQIVLDAPPIPSAILAHIRSLLPPLGSHRFPEEADGGDCRAGHLT